MADDFDLEAYVDQYLRETGGRRSVTNPVTVPSPSSLKFAFDIVKQKQTPPLGDPEDGDTGGEADRDVLEDLIADEYGLPPVEIPQSQADAIRGYFEAVEPLITAEGGRGQATAKPKPKPPTKSGYARVTASEREGPIFMPWEIEGMTDEELMRIGPHPSQQRTLPPMDTTREHTVADKERRAQQVAERQATEEDADALRKQNLRNMRQATGVSTAVVTREGGTGGGGGTDGGGPEGLGYDSPTVQTNTDIYKKHLPKELHNDPMALAEAAKDAAAKNYFNLMEENNNEPKEDWGVEIDGEPWTEMIFANGETFFVSEDESQILRGKDQES